MRFLLPLFIWKLAYFFPSKIFSKCTIGLPPPQLMFAPIFCGQVVTGGGGSAGFPGRTRRSGLVSVRRRLHQSPVCPVERDVVWHLRIYVHGQPITHIGKWQEQHEELQEAKRECGWTFSLTRTPQDCVPRFMYSRICVSSSLYFFFGCYMRCGGGSSSKILRITHGQQKKQKNERKTLRKFC